MGLPHLSTRYGNGSSKARSLEWERSGGGGLHSSSLPPHSCHCRLLFGLVPVRGMEWSKTKAETGKFSIGAKCYPATCGPSAS